MICDSYSSRWGTAAASAVDAPSHTPSPWLAFALEEAARDAPRRGVFTVIDCQRQKPMPSRGFAAWQAVTMTTESP
jgi:hypothetical protein